MEPEPLIVSVVTGASSGIGKAIYKHLQQTLGEPVVGISRTGPDIPLDLSRTSHVKAVPLHIRHLLGLNMLKVRHLVNCAGMLSLDEEYPQKDDWLQVSQTTMDLNFWAPYLLSMQLLPSMIDGESTITNISSISAIRPEYDLPVYSASKAALSAMSRSLALALAPRKIRVNTIAPGFFRTNLVFGETPQHLLDKIPLGAREAMPEEIIPVFDAIRNSEYMTGTEIVVDGGLQWAK